MFIILLICLLFLGLILLITIARTPCVKEVVGIFSSRLQSEIPREKDEDVKPSIGVKG